MRENHTKINLVEFSNGGRMQLEVEISFLFLNGRISKSSLPTLSCTVFAPVIDFFLCREKMLSLSQTELHFALSTGELL